MDSKKIQVVILEKGLNLGVKVEKLKYVADFNSQAQGVFEKNEIGTIANKLRIRKERLLEKQQQFLDMMKFKESVNSIKAKQQELERLTNILEKPPAPVKSTPKKKKKSFLGKLFNW